MGDLAKRDCQSMRRATFILVSSSLLGSSSDTVLELFGDSQQSLR